MKIRFSSVSILLLLLLAVGSLAQAKKCGSFDAKVTYKILSRNTTSKDSQKRIYLEIYLKPDRFTVVSMIRLTERLRSEYCEFDSIAVSIFDTEKLEKMPDPPPQPLIDWRSNTPPKGFYEFNRKANTAELTFQEKRDSKVYDVEIVFRADGYCISEMITQLSKSRQELVPMVHRERSSLSPR